MPEVPPTRKGRRGAMSGFLEVGVVGEEAVEVGVGEAVAGACTASVDILCDDVDMLKLVHAGQGVAKSRSSSCV